MPHPWSPPKFAAPLEKSKKICMFHHIVEVKQPHPMKPNGKAGSRGHRRNSPPHKAIFPPLQMTKPPGINGSGRLSLFSQGPCVSPFPPEASPEPPNRDSIRSKVLGGREGSLRGERGPFFRKVPSPPPIFYSSSTKHRVRSSSVSRRRMSLGVPSLVMSTSAARGRWL